MTAIRNFLALPLIGLAVGLWWVADRLAKLSQVMGDGAMKIAGPERQANQTPIGSS
jgi:hypothetical protein